MPAARPARRRAILYVGPSADVGARRERRAALLDGSSRRPAPPAAARAPEARPDAGSLPAAPGRGPETSSRLTSLRPVRQHLRARQPEGRRRQDDDRGQPGRVPRRGGRDDARRRSRPAGERDLRARRARERRLRPTTFSTARPLDEVGARDALPRISTSCPRRPELAGAAVELARREDGETLPRRARSRGARRILLHLRRLPAVARPADGERAGCRRPCARPGAVRVLRARGARAAAPLVELVRGRLNPRLSVAGMILTMVDGRTRLAADVAAEVRRALRRARLRGGRAAQRPPCGGAEPRSSRSPRTTVLGRRRRLLPGGRRAPRPRRCIAAAAA